MIRNDFEAEDIYILSMSWLLSSFEGYREKFYQVRQLAGHAGLTIPCFRSTPRDLFEYHP